MGFYAVIRHDVHGFPESHTLLCGHHSIDTQVSFLYMSFMKKSDLQKYIADRKKTDSEFADDFDDGYEQFKIGVMLRQARESAGLTQEELAIRLKTKKTAISRIENHGSDIKLSTLDRVAKALGKRLQVHIT